MSKWVDAWEERLAFIGPQKLAITGFADSRRSRLELFDITRSEGRTLVRLFGGEIKNLSNSSADWAKHLIRKTPISIRGRLKIVNDESKPLGKIGSPEIYIPAGLAFGTGEHATTATCLRMLCDVAPGESGWHMLDIGTGTGILAIAAARLGAGRVIGLDFDPTAIATAKQNARANAIQLARFRKADIRTWSSSEQFQIVCANLYSDILIEAMPRIWAAVAARGCLIASGVLRSHAEGVLRKIEEFRGRICRAPARGKWVTVLARKE
jgi:ribosomal protein L11 methyltransferase